jgi:hypothetical protein
LSDLFKDKFSSKEIIYAYSFNKTLLEMPISELIKVKNIKARYLQIDSKNKCVPTDWYLGYDTFIIYTFLQLGGNNGFLKFYFEEVIIDFE